MLRGWKKADLYCSRWDYVQMKMLALMKYSDKAASTRQRLLQFRKHFSHQGIEIEFCPFLSNDYLEQTFRGNAAPIFSS